MKKFLTTLFAVLLYTAAHAQTYTTLQWGLDKTATPYNFGASIAGTWSNLGTISSAGVWTLSPKNVYSQSVSVLSYLTEAQRADVLSGAAALDLAIPINTALNTCPAAGQSQHLYFPPGVYGVKSELIAQTCPVDIELDANATIKQTGNISPTATSAFQNYGLLHFKTGASGSVLHGGTINGNRSALVSTYLTLPTNVPTSGTTGYSIAAAWNCVFSDTGANKITIHDVTLTGCMSAGIYQINADDFTVHDIKIFDSSAMVGAQSSRRHRWSNVKGVGIANTTIGTAIPSYAYAFVLADIDDADVSHVSVINYSPVYCTTGTLIGPGNCAGGNYIGDPAGAAVILQRVYNTTVSDIIADGFIHTDPRSSPVASGFQCDSCTATKVSGLVTMGYYYGADFASPTNVTFSDAVVNCQMNYNPFMGTSSFGVRVSGNGHAVFNGNSFLDYYRAAGANNFVATNISETSCFRGLAIQSPNVSISNSTFNANQYWGVEFWSELSAAGFPGSPGVPIKNVALSNVTAAYNGGDGFRYNDGINSSCDRCWAIDNGQLSTTTMAATGINVVSNFGTKKQNLLFSNWGAIDDQSFTNVKSLSFVPGTATGSTYKVLESAGVYNVGQNIVCQSCGTGASNINLFVTDISDDVLTVKTTGTPTFSTSACTVALVGTVSGTVGTTTLTGSGTSFTTAIQGPVYLAVGGNYYRVNNVLDNTHLVINTSLLTSPSSAPASLVQCNATGIPSQTVGFRAQNAPAYIGNISIGDPASYVTNGNTTYQVDFAPASATADWTSYTPTVTFTAGTSPVASNVSGSYRLDGKTLCFSVSAQVAYTTPPTQVIFTLPNDAVGNAYNTGAISAIAGMNATTYALLSGQMNIGAHSFALVPAPGNSLFSASGQYVGGGGCVKIQ